MSTPYVLEQVKCDQACKHYKTCKHILFIQGQSLKNDFNEHITGKCSSGHVKKKQLITNVSKSEPMLPLTLYKLPLKIFSPFSTGMAKGLELNLT